MRIPSLLFALTLSATAFAQSPLTTTFASNNGQAGNMFDIVALNASGITIDSFDVNVDSGTWDLEVYKLTIPGPYLPSVNTAGDWTLVGSATGVVSNGLNNPTQLPICVSEFIPSGATQSFYVTVTNGTSINYTNGSATGSVFASNADLEFLEGAGLAYPFTANFNPRVFNGNIYYTVGNVPTVCAFASKESFGSGCYNSFASFYEIVDSAGMDLSGMTVTGVTNGTGGFDVTTAAGTVAPIGGSAVQLTLGDDDQIDTADPAVGGTLGLFVGSNGWVAQGDGNSTTFAPTAALMLNNPSAAVYAWTDLQPNAAGSGQTFYEESGTVATVTYDGVFGWGTTDPNTIQIVLDTATGDFSITFGALGVANPEDWLIGQSPAGPNADPGSSDLTAGPISTASVDVIGLSFDCTVPFAGSIWDLTIENIDSGSPFAVFAFGNAAVNPGFDLGGIGAPGCSLYTNGNLGFFTAPLSANSSRLSVLIPNLAVLLGSTATAQGAAFTPLNALNIATSNGISVSVGK